MELEFSGIDELIKEIDRIEGLTDDLKDKALIAGGDLLRDRMKEEVYAHGLRELTGEGRESLIRTDPKNHELFVGTQGGKKQPGFYLYMHEFGFYNVRARRFIAPRPFASIAYENSKDDILTAYVEEFRKGLGMS
ncbi:hypothetical protein [Sporosarcina highlanderae]|uniref:HK97 gp10 family phage protein n=1 Tax=Sporosarcina highlanderae TaxID=3035916 RepID=A0ABT8JVM3_9BACL|nr:hypothetical protein [Sporosarcina highlanderae]MDN4609124.1 hypothetical protein [Sporosarcina highlanderae]